MLHATQRRKPYASQPAGRMPESDCRNGYLCKWLLAVLVWFLGFAMVVALTASVRADEAAEEAAGYLRRCRALADRLEQAGHPQAAAQVRAHTFPRDPHRQYVFFVGGRTRLKAG
ncbi:MAG TPA: hypothetical protein ENJ50_11345, partial [Planctomycetaceae bacterium]|nr:hypothetical protein [Planctomycetaceae bacterium]